MKFSRKHLETKQTSLISVSLLLLLCMALQTDSGYCTEKKSVNTDKTKQYLKELNNYLSKYPKNEIALERRAELLMYDLDDNHGARIDYATLAQLRPNDSTLRYLIGETHFFDQEYAEAIKNYRQAIEIGQKNLKTIETAPNEKLVEIYPKFTGRASRNSLKQFEEERIADCHMKLGSCLKNQAEFDKAIEEMENALAIDKRHGIKHLDWIIETAFLQVQIGRKEEAKIFYDLIKHRSLSDGDELRMRAHVAYILGDNDKCIADYDRALVLHPDEACIYHDYAEYWLNQGDWKKARELSEKSLPLEPQHWGHYRDNAYLLYRMGELKLAGERAAKGESIRQENNKKRTGERNPDKLISIATIQLIEGNFEKAKEEALKLIALSQQIGKGYEILGDAEYARGDFEKALAAYDKLLKQTASLDVRYRRALCLQKLKREKEAQTEFNKIKEQGYTAASETPS